MNRIVPESVLDMASIKSRFNALLAKKEERENRKIDRMAIVREAGIAYPTVATWIGEGDDEVTFDRLHSETVIRLCVYLECDLGDLLYIDRTGEI